MNLPKIYTLFDEVDDALRSRYEPVLDAALAQANLNPSDLSVLMAVYAWEPQPATAWMFGVRGPYTDVNVYVSWLSGAATRGLLDEVSPERYRLSVRGREIHDSLLIELRAAMEVSGSYPQVDVERFASLLKKIGESMLMVPPPPEKWSFNLSHCHYPGDAASVMGRIDQWITDLRSYRDDAHLTAWRAEGLSAPALESLTFIWRGEATSLNAVCEKFSRRGRSREVYAAALNELRARGWLTGSDEVVQLTSSGRDARERIEQRTDEMFYRPWSVLSGSELNDLKSLAQLTRDVLKG